MPGTTKHNVEFEPKKKKNATNEEKIFGAPHWEFQTILLNIKDYPNLFFALPPYLNIRPSGLKKNGFYKGIDYYNKACRMNDLYKEANEDMKNIKVSIVDILLNSSGNKDENVLFPIAQEMNSHFQTCLLMLACGFIDTDTGDLNMFNFFVCFFDFLLFPIFCYFFFVCNCFFNKGDHIIMKLLEIQCRTCDFRMLMIGSIMVKNL